MFGFDEQTDRLAEAVIAYALERVRMDPPPLDHPQTIEALRASVGDTVTEAGIGWEEALRRFSELLAPATLSVDHPRFLAFVPAAPTEAAVLFDLVVGASSIYAGSWMEGGGAVFAENQALAWLASLAGMPESAGGVFLSGGSAGNLSALVAARHAARTRAAAAGAGLRPSAVVASSGAHSSIVSAARVMDADVVEVPADERGRLTGDALRRVLAARGHADVFAVVATAGTTNLGIVDDLAGVSAACRDHGIWFHVDGAYGGAALAAPSVRHLFDGIEDADSFVVDPHKWLFAPFDCAALLYRDPEAARQAHTQKASYLDVLQEHDEWNPSDFAYHLSRRARGLPFWFSLATHGTAAYSAAVESTLATTRAGAELIRAATHLELVLEPELSVLLFRRVGWSQQEYQRWSDAILDAGEAFVVPTSWKGETLLRLCLVNPQTTVDDLAWIVDSLG